jgi:glutaredoxin
VPSMHPRCAQHGLAVAPDGLCVLCRRERSAPVGSTTTGAPDAATGYTPPLSASPARPAASPSPAKWVGLGALLLLAAAGAGFALELTSSEQVAVQPTAASGRLSEAAFEHSTEQRELDKSKAADLEASLKMLERAEAERVQKQQLAAAQADEQYKVKLAAREQEERERDRARHEAVTRDLDTVAFNKLRGNVQITMYSTEWCGVCTRARKYMHDKRIPFKELDVEKDEQARRSAHALNPRGGVPTIAIDKEVLVGFSPESLEHHISRAAQARKL